MENKVKIAFIFLVLMFIISGSSHTISLGSSESERLSKQLNLNVNISQVIVFLAGLWELVSSLILLYSIFTNKYNLTFYSIISLIIFTILATLIFYVYPFSYKPFLSNLSVMAGLALTLSLCPFKNQ